MKAAILAVGRLRRPFEEADAHYRKLLARHQQVEVAEGRNDRDLLRRLPADAHIVAIERKGRAMDSIAWSKWLERRRLEARDVCLVLGGPHGLPAEAIAAADELISLGPHTMSHQLARIVLLEQLFRAAKILAGEPYHR
jgi:23S rRNA (pseudouridine1915-N3)-methyltransferase